VLTSTSIATTVQLNYNYFSRILHPAASTTTGVAAANDVDVAATSTATTATINGITVAATNYC